MEKRYADKNFNYIKYSEHFKDYLGYRLDIISNNPKRWLGTSYHELPSFEYYIKSVVLDRGGLLDFTIRNINIVSTNYIFDKKVSVSFNRKCSTWMETNFNFEKQIIWNV